jgi:hypothetical protein
MTRTQLFVTLSLVICATAPCADGMAAAPQIAPVVPDAWWHGVNEVRAIVSASMNGRTIRIAEFVVALLLVWRYGSLQFAKLAGGRPRRPSTHTIVGGFPAAGVMSGIPQFSERSRVAGPRMASGTRSPTARTQPTILAKSQVAGRSIGTPIPVQPALDPSGTERYAACPDARPVCHG